MFVLSGLILGLVFGFILHRGGLVRYSRIMGVLLMRDFKAMKFMFFAVSVAMLLYGLSDLAGVGAVPRVNAYLGVGHLIGGLLFGVGMALSGF